MTTIETKNDILAAIKICTKKIHVQLEVSHEAKLSVYFTEYNTYVIEINTIHSPSYLILHDGEPMFRKTFELDYMDYVKYWASRYDLPVVELRKVEQNFYSSKTYEIDQ